MKLERMEQDNVGTRMQHVMPCGIHLFFIQSKLYIFYMVCAIQTFTCRYWRLLQQPLLPFYPLESWKHAKLIKNVLKLWGFGKLPLFFLVCLEFSLPLCFLPEFPVCLCFVCTPEVNLPVISDTCSAALKPWLHTPSPYLMSCLLFHLTCVNKYCV